MLFAEIKWEGLTIFDRATVRTMGFQVVVGDGQEDRDALERDLQKLPEEWRKLVRY